MKTGPKPLYGETKQMRSFRLSPLCMHIILEEADKKSCSQAEVIEQWSRRYYRLLIAKINAKKAKDKNCKAFISNK